MVWISGGVLDFPFLWHCCGYLNFWYGRNHNSFLFCVFSYLWGELSLPQYQHIGFYSASFSLQLWHRSVLWGCLTIHKTTVFWFPRYIRSFFVPAVIFYLCCGFWGFSRTVRDRLEWNRLIFSRRPQHDGSCYFWEEIPGRIRILFDTWMEPAPSSCRFENSAPQSYQQSLKKLRAWYSAWSLYGWFWRGSSPGTHSNDDLSFWQWSWRRSI